MVISGVLQESAEESLEENECHVLRPNLRFLPFKKETLKQLPENKYRKATHKDTQKAQGGDGAGAARNA